MHNITVCKTFTQTLGLHLSLLGTKWMSLSTGQHELGPGEEDKGEVARSDREKKNN